MRFGSGRVHQPPTVFVEGEPDLEPPEELAVEVFDESGLLRDDVDCELVDETDVDEETADAAFDELVHAADEEADNPTWSPDEFLCHGCFQIIHRQLLADPSGPLCQHCCS